MNKKMRARKRRQARRVALTLVLMLTVALVSIGGTIAWLTATSGTVTNTFTVGDVGLTLVEHKYNTEDTDAVTTETTTAQNYPLIPGTVYAKDPVVTVSGNVDAWLFVQFDPSNSTTYLSYTSNLKTPDWTQGDGTTIPSNVWYRSVPAPEAGAIDNRSWHLIEGDVVTVPTTIVKANDTNNVPNATVMPTSNVTMTYKAWAVQQDNLTAQQAWDVAQDGVLTTNP